MGHIVFDSSTIRARHLPGRQGVLVVTFPNRSPDIALHDQGFGEGFLKRHALSAIHVTASANHYWQSADLWPAMSAIRAFAGSERLVAYGSSMGAYGALLCSGALDAHTVIALSPIYSVNPEKVPFDKQRRVGGPPFSNDNLGERICRSARRFIFFDPLSHDRRHAGLICGLHAGSTLVPLPFAGHPCTTFLSEIGALSRIVLRLIEGGDLDALRWRADVRMARARSATYWRSMSRLAQRRKRLALAIESGRRALAHSLPGHASAQSAVNLGAALGLAGRHQDAIDTLLDVIASHPSHVPAYTTLAAVYRDSKNPGAALQQLDRALALDPRNRSVGKLKATFARQA